MPQNPVAPTPKFHPAARKGPAPSQRSAWCSQPRPGWGAGETGSFLVSDLNQKLLQDPEAKRPSTSGPPLPISQVDPEGQGLTEPPGTGKDEVRGFEATPDNRNQIGSTAAHSSGRDTWLDATPHRNAFGQQNEKEGDGGPGVGRGVGEEEGGDELEKSSGEVKKTK